MELKIDAKLYSDGKLETKEYWEQLDGPREQVTRQIYDLREQALHDALVKLGWTPPDSNK